VRLDLRRQDAARRPRRLAPGLAAIDDGDVEAAVAQAQRDGAADDAAADDKDVRAIWGHAHSITRARRRGKR
jgi:hypothetical protein